MPAGQPGPSGPDRNCDLCPRLKTFRDTNREAFPDYFNAPVPAWGAFATARLAIVGLAPGLRGANRTGRPFTGDFAGDLLYATLLKFGFATGKFEKSIHDSLQLVDCAILNAVRCVPPQNKPTPAEIHTCRRFLMPALAEMPKLTIVLALGRIAHESLLRGFGEKLSARPFAHGAIFHLTQGQRSFHLHDSYHCSRYNTQTGVLTPASFEAIFAQIRHSMST
ncbi:MAG: uracil-DNA glycosylase [Hyphomicrobiales bacterium]|nr:uracil-DNA glycosylase [Hyphomicrobiales bacterium]MDE2115629.1 uracil-DNA glycosylase [Hyphomicrobiales bacterium]